MHILRPALAEIGIGKKLSSLSSVGAALEAGARIAERLLLIALHRSEERAAAAGTPLLIARRLLISHRLLKARRLLIAGLIRLTEGHHLVSTETRLHELRYQVSIGGEIGSISPNDRGNHKGDH